METGDGLRMGAWIGAKVQDFHAPMTHHMGSGMGVTPFLQINKRGDRFMNECIPGQQLENQIELQRTARAGRSSTPTGLSSCPICPQPTAVPATMRLRQRGRRPQEQHYLPQLQEPLSAGSCCGRWPRCEGRHAGRAGGKDLPGRYCRPADRSGLHPALQRAGQGRLR